MDYIYPVARKIENLSKTALAVKIARHSICRKCDPETPCQGLHPPPDVTVTLDTSSEEDSSLGNLDQYGSDDEDDKDSRYLRECECGHGLPEHGADENVLGIEEYNRLGRAAFRLDEILMVRFPFSL